MSRHRLIISEQAARDLSDIWLYIANDSPEVADRFLDYLLEQCRLLSSSPEMGRLRDEVIPGLRSFPVKRYIVFYRVKADSVEVIRILSGYRDVDAIF